MVAEVSEILSTEQYAELTRRKPQSIRRERMRGDGPPYFRIGRRVFYRCIDIERFFESRTVNNTAEECVREVR
jgi:hypothetical protein